MQTPLVNLCDRIATDPGSHCRSDHDDKSDPRTSSSHAGHCCLQRKLRTAIGPTTSGISGRRSSEVDCCQNSLPPVLPYR
jgi:hypothetical protein